MKNMIVCAMAVAMLAVLPVDAKASDSNVYVVTFPEDLDVSVCAGKNLLFASQVIIVDQSTGIFNTVWSPSNPNTLSCAGSLTSTSVGATLQCASGLSQAMGGFSATGPGDGTYTGTYTFNGTTGPVAIFRSTSSGGDDKPPVLTNPSLTPNPSKVGEEILFKGDINTKGAPQTAMATITWGDGSPAETYGIDLAQDFKRTGLTHTYSSPGVFNIHVKFFDGANPSGGSDDFDFFQVVGDASVAVNGNTGVNVVAQVVSGGTVNLTINPQTLSNATNATTTFEDSDGMTRAARGAATGLNVQETLGASGLYVATSDLMDNASNKVGKIRKTVGIGKKIAGESDGLNDPSSTKLSIKGVKGKFNFSTAKSDVVTFSGQFLLPPGFSPSLPGVNSIEFSIGNVVDTVQIDPKKKSGTGQRGRIKKLKLTYPKLKTGVAAGTENAKINAELNIANLTGAGFDTEGITASRGVSETGSKAVTRFIQVNLLVSGVTYETLAPVNYTISKDSSLGSITGRR